LYVLLAATGLRVSEALAVENKHFTNNGRTIIVEQQVKKDSPEVVKYLKTDAAKRQVDLHPDVAEYFQRYRTGKTGLLFHTAHGTPHLYGNLEDRWLTSGERDLPRQIAIYIARQLGSVTEGNRS